MTRQLNDNILKRILAIKDDYADTMEATSQELRLYHWFHAYLCDEMGQIGREEISYTFRQSHQGTLLIYKTRHEGTQWVVFVTAGTPVGCMRILCRQFYNETLKWVPDKYQ